MYQTIRKTVSLLLAVVLILACGVMAVAAAPKTAEQQASCTHSWNAGYTEYIKGKGIYVSNTCCRRWAVTTKTCTKCGETTVKYHYVDLPKHDGYIKSATCNGTWQTHTSLCNYCNSYYTEQFRCRGNHGPSCPYLPI